MKDLSTLVKSQRKQVFVEVMNRKHMYSLAIVIAIFFSSLLLLSKGTDASEFSEVVKIALRDIGNRLLLINQDSTSRILPVVALSDSKYQLSFEHRLAIEPDDLVTSVQKSFQRSSLPAHYRVEVIQCADQEVAYSFEISADEESTIIPCAGRDLPEGCYTIEVGFIEKVSFPTHQTLFAIPISIAFTLFLTFLFTRKRQDPLPPVEQSEKFEAIGSFLFYPNQNKLVKGSTEINLSRKECELLVIFAANINLIVSRDELMKKVWEDKGVFVGRSLDTYISKLRKKLSADEEIKLRNVHGVGYKLEVTV